MRSRRSVRTMWLGRSFSCFGGGLLPLNLRAALHAASPSIAISYSGFLYTYKLYICVFFCPYPFGENSDDLRRAQMWQRWSWRPQIRLGSLLWSGECHRVDKWGLEGTLEVSLKARWTDRRYTQNWPCVLQDILSFGAIALFIKNILRTKENYSIADHRES